MLINWVVLFFMVLGWNPGPGNCSTLDRYADLVFYFGRNPRFTLFKFPSDGGVLDDHLCSIVRSAY